MNDGCETTGNALKAARFRTDRVATKSWLSGFHSRPRNDLPADLDGALVAHDEKDRADDSERNFQPSIDHERQVKIGQGEHVKWSAPDREQIDEQADEQCSQIANAVMIEDAQQKVRSNDTESSTDDRPEVKPTVKIGATTCNEKDET